MRKMSQLFLYRFFLFALSISLVASCTNTAPISPSSTPAVTSSTAAVPDSRGSSSTASRQIEDEEEAELMGDVRRRNAEREESNLPETQKNLLRRTKLISNDTPEDKDRNLRIEYKRNLVHELTKHWHLMKGDSAPVVAIRIGRDGTIQAAKIRKSSGDETVDQAAIKAVYDLHLPPFDAMIKAKKLGFRVDFNRIVAKQQKEADKVLAGKRR